MPLQELKSPRSGATRRPGVLTNDDLEKMVDTNDQWILERTGISERHIAEPDVATSDLATAAQRKAALAAPRHRRFANWTPFWSAP